MSSLIRSQRYGCLFLLGLFAFTGCDRPDPAVEAESEIAEAEVARQVVQRGSVKLSVELKPKTPRLSDQPTLVVRVEAKPGTAIKMPTFGPSIGDFWIREFYEPLPKSRHGIDVREQIYELEPSHAGELILDPIAVRFAGETAAENPNAQQTLATESMSVNVATAIEPDEVRLKNLQPPAGPMQASEPQRPIAWAAGAIGAVVLAVVMLLWFARSRDKKSPAESPQQQARKELDDLLDQQLATTDVKAFYVELTGIVRRFIERAYGARAPEQTTDEFLRGITEGSEFSTREQQQLRQFLEAADLVKFAGARPQHEEIEASVDRARDFINASSQAPATEQTADREVNQ